MIRATQGFVYNKFEAPNDWPIIDKTFDYKIEEGKLVWANPNIYLLKDGTKIYSTSNLLVVPSNFTYGNTTTSDIGYVDVDTQEFIAASIGTIIGKDFDGHNLIVDNNKISGSVGYFVIGSPTITDGIVSNFSGSDLLTVSNNMPSYNSFEMQTTFTFGADITSVNQTILIEQNNNMRLWKLSGENFIKLRFYDNSILDIRSLATSYTVQASTTYICKVIFKDSKLEIFLYDENGQLLDSNSISDVDIYIVGKTKIGSLGTSNGYFSGSIDLNNTYIKINGVLWFGKENWKPSIYTDNAIYLLACHSSDFSSYNQIGFNPTISNIGRYDVIIDNQIVLKDNSTPTLINWNDLNLTTGYDISTPSNLKAHVIKITPSLSTNTIIGYKSYTV